VRSERGINDDDDDDDDDNSGVFGFEIRLRGHLYPG
jgi:hypothetical protein